MLIPRFPDLRGDPHRKTRSDSMKAAYWANIWRPDDRHFFHGWARIYQEFSVGLPLEYAFDLPKMTVGAFAHIFYPDMAQMMIGKLRESPVTTDLCISTDTEEKAETIRQVAADTWKRDGKVIIRITPNRGRDIAPLLIGYRDLLHSYDAIVHVHSKRSPHEPVLADWGNMLFEGTIGSRGIMASILHILDEMDNIGVLAPQHFDFLRPWINWGQNEALCRDLFKRIDLHFDPAVCDFPSGSMFWARPRALDPLLYLNLSYDDFPEETGQVDGTLAHALERMIFVSSNRVNLDWFRTAVPDAYRGKWSILPPRNDVELWIETKKRTASLIPNYPIVGIPNQSMKPPVRTIAEYRKRL